MNLFVASLINKTLMMMMMMMMMKIIIIHIALSALGICIIKDRCTAM